ncbi:M23 family metallopeptidase [Sedimentibacter sp.]|uniref:M23 family metallopeptidase n=1 Tax=Sedimentibacter sp. TaxID=1960295 RepID=UPI0028ADEA80|nr:M23 family metallopeptidase [Sedimentibacter sp.]
MLNLKKLLSLTITILMVIVSLCSPAFSIENSHSLETTLDKKIEFESTNSYTEDENLTQLERLSIEEFIKNRKPDIILNIERLNYNNPIMLNKISDNEFEVKLWDKFFELGNVAITIESDDGHIAFNDTLSDEQHNMKIKLKSSKKYIYNLKIECKDGSSIFYLGEILEDKDGSRLINILVRDQGFYNDMPIASNIEEVEKFKMSDASYDTSNFIVPMSVKGDDVWEKEPNDNKNQAITIKNNDNAYGTMHGTDRVDYYKVVFGRAGKANFWLGNIPSGKPHYLYIYEGDSSSPKWKSTLSGTQQLISSVNVQKGTTYYIKVEYPSGTVPTGANYWLRAKMLPDLYWPGPTSPTIPSTISCCYKCPDYEDEELGITWPHKGIDIIGREGDLIYSVLDGTVSSRSFDGTSGYQIYIEHPDNPASSSTGTYLKTFYCHMNNQALYAPGAQVWAKQHIGYIGKTGLITGAHLHFGTYYSNNGTSWYEFNPLKLWSGKSFYCNTCYNYVSSNSAYSDNYIDRDTFHSNYKGLEKRRAGISINETTIDIETLINMPEIDIKRLNLKQKDLETFSSMIANDGEYSLYLNDISNMSIK